MHLEPFQLFGFQHLATIAIIFLIIFGVAFYFKAQDEGSQRTAGIAIAVLIIVHHINGIFNTFTFNHNWQEAFPLHMCDLSAFAIAYYLWKREKIFFNCAFFWGIGGATMALLTPELDYAFPNAVFIPFFYGHGLVLLGVGYASIALQKRPYLRDVHKVIGISLVGMGFIYLFNLISSISKRSNC